MKKVFVAVLALACLSVTVPVVSFASEPTKAGQQAAVQIDINTASSEELQRLPGIGKSIAQRILEFREKGGRFNTPDDLMQVKGVGKKTMENIRPMVAVK